MPFLSLTKLDLAKRKEFCCFAERCSPGAQCRCIPYRILAPDTVQQTRDSGQCDGRRTLLMVLNAASAALLCLGARALLRERRLNNHERLKCFLHVLIALTSQVSERSLNLQVFAAISAPHSSATLHPDHQTAARPCNPLQ